MTPQFVDISAYQGTIDFSAYAAWARQWDGIARVAMKSSEGTGFVDPAFTANRTRALEAGIDEIYYYHFARPDLGNSPVAEADFMQSVVGAIRPQDMIILDYEVQSPLSTAAWALAWLVEFGPKYGKIPGIYASSAYIAERLQWPGLDAFPLWLANWQFTPDERPPCPPPWTSYGFVQYTDKAVNVPGIPGAVDVNIFLGGNTPMSSATSTTIDLTNGTVASHFSGTDNTIWQCKGNGFIIGHAILDFYRSFGGTALCGLTFLGLPTSNEQGVGHPGVVYQRFERGVLAYDSQKILDNPPGSGSVYLMHIDSGIGQDPRIAQLQGQITDLQGQITALQAQLTGNTLAQENTALQAKIAQAVKDLQ